MSSGFLPGFGRAQRVPLSVTAEAVVLSLMKRVLPMWAWKHMDVLDNSRAFAEIRATPVAGVAAIPRIRCFWGGIDIFPDRCLCVPPLVWRNGAASRRHSRLRPRKRCQRMLGISSRTCSTARSQALSNTALLTSCPHSRISLREPRPSA